ncbi:MAG: type II secretion system protein [candidate division Zixibacteria bacterium]|jgi:prepilin-type N-terminal cleavage/methylation domain-containing protein|nr:type II secretion system protein [candidate division Zixibacteria bacterium]
MCSSRPKIASDRGFTLIELVMIIVILGIIAAVATPAFVDMHSDAMENACKASLYSIREAISHFQMHAVVRGDGEQWPSMDSIAVPGVVLAHRFPPNPFQAEDRAPDSVVEGVTPGVVVGTRGGWAYKPGTGQIWPNTSTVIEGSGCAGDRRINENLW